MRDATLDPTPVPMHDPTLHPTIIQGGMGVAVSDWRLAAAVGKLGQLGVVAGTALDVVHARRLGDGDDGGDLRRAYAQFPVPALAGRVLDRWFVPGDGQTARAIAAYHSVGSSRRRRCVSSP